MADALRAKLTDAEGLKLRALVVGASGEGVALVGKTAETATAVRRGSVLAEVVDGVKVEVAIERVTAYGVKLATSERKKGVTLPGSFTPLATPTNAPAEFLSYVEGTKVPVDALMRLVADQTGVNISSTDATARKTVSIFLRNVTADAAVEEICRTAGLWFRREPETRMIRVTTMKEYAENLSSFREETTKTFTLLYPNVVEIASVIYGLYPERTLLSLGEEEFQQDDEYDLSRRFRRFRVIEENGNSQFMEMQAPRSSSSSGGTGGGTFSYSRGNALSRLTQWDQLRERNRIGGRGQFATPDAMLAADAAKRIESAARAADTNAYETAYRSATPSAANIFVSMSRKNNMLIVRTSDVKVMDEITRLVKKLDVPTPMVLMELKIMELDVTDDFQAGFNWGLSELATTSANSTMSTDDSGNVTYTSSATQERVKGIRSGTLGSLSTSTESSKTYSQAGALTAVSSQQTLNETANLAMDLTQGGAVVANPTFAFSLLSDKIASSIQLMQQDGKVKVLSTPTLLTANNEVSRIFNGHEYPLVTGWTKSETVVSTYSPAIVSPATAEIERKDIGTMLLITPNINSDKTVTLRLLQENSELAPDKAQIPVDGASGETKEIDYVESRSLTGTFVAKDGMTILAGGLISEKDQVTYWRTPFLGSIPYLGWLFRGTEKAKRRTEMVILITPHVIMTPYEGGKVSEELVKVLSAHPCAEAGKRNMGLFKGDEKGRKEHTIKDDLKNLVE